MTILLTLVTALKFTFDSFSAYDFKNKEYYLTLKPDLSFNISYKNFRFYADAGYPYFRTKNRSVSEFKIYQLYGKFQSGGFEAKGGKLVFIPGFLGLFNPFYSIPAFENLAFSFEGETGLFLRYYFKGMEPVIFIRIDTFKKTPQVKLQFSSNLKKFSSGIYVEHSDETGFGAFIGYFGNFTLKTQGFIKDTNLKAVLSFEFPIKSAITSLWFSYSNTHEMFLLPSIVLFTKRVFAIDVQWNVNPFETPRIVVFYDLDNKIPVALFHYRYTVNNNIALEGGSFLYRRNNTLYPMLFLGFRLTKGF